MIRPLGRLNNDNGFQRHDFLLQLFILTLNKMTKGWVTFLYDGSDCISDCGEVIMNLVEGLLWNVSSELKRVKMIT